MAKLAGDDTFHILTVPSGTATIDVGAESMTLRTGETVLLPAAHEEVAVAVTPASTLFEAHVPD